MSQLLITGLVEQRQYFDSGATLSSEFRLTQLKKLRQAVVANEDKILAALATDLGKPPLEAYASEIAPVISELDYAITNLKSWLKPRKVATPLKLFRSKSYISMQPLGCVLIIAPWNYPFQLLLAPLIGALAAGNCAVVKPSELTPSVATVISELLNNCFSEQYVVVINGDGAQIVPDLIRHGSFNHVFFTGSPKVGALIAGECASRLIPYTLELGGKSPAIIDKSSNLAVTAKRVVWSKFFNGGQTCIAPDYVLVERQIYPQLLAELSKAITTFKLDQLGNMSKIVSDSHFQRLINYLSQGKIITGGNFDSSRRLIAATVITDLAPDASLLSDEIFGPILPVLCYDNREELLNIIRRNRYPLSCYIYSQDQQFINSIIDKVETGSIGVNIGLYQFANHHLPFGGVMNSGHGRYHGKASFELFSNPVSVIDCALVPDLPFKYPPYSKFKEWLFRKI